MFNQFEELRVGTKFYQWRTYSGFVEFEVKSKHDHGLFIRSVSSIGYDFNLNEEAFTKSIEAGRIFYKNLESAQNSKNEQDAKRQREYVDRFRDDKAAFTEELLQRAYAKEIDGEYGDDVVAKAIRELGEIHFPRFEVQ